MNNHTKVRQSGGIHQPMVNLDLTWSSLVEEDEHPCKINFRPVENKAKAKEPSSSWTVCSLLKEDNPIARVLLPV